MTMQKRDTKRGLFFSFFEFRVLLFRVLLFRVYKERFFWKKKKALQNDEREEVSLE